MTTAIALSDQWDPNSGLPMPAYLADALGDMGSNIADRMNVPSLSYEGKTWTIVKDGNKTKLQSQNSDGDMVPVPVMRLVILNFNADRGRAFYEGVYNPAASTAPKCWSPDGKAPDPSVKEKQAALCQGCPQSVKGSKVQEGKEMVACSSHRMIAIAPAMDLTADPLRLKIAVTSDYDKDIVEHGWYAFRQYTDWLKSRGVSHTGLVVTKVKFDPNTAYPKLLFALDRLLTQEEVVQVKETLKNPKVAELLAEKWTAAGTAGTPVDDADIKPWGLEGAYADGWQAHNDNPAYSWKGSEVVKNEDLAARYPKPEPVAPAIPASEQVIEQPPQAPAPPPAPAPEPVVEAAKPKPTDAAHIAHAGTEHEVWWDGAAWVKPWATEAAAPAAAPPPPPAPAPAPEPAAPPKPTDPAHIAHAGTEHEVWWDGAAWVKPWGNGQTAAGSTASAATGGAATTGQAATTAASPSEVPADVQGLLDKWTGG